VQLRLFNTLTRQIELFEPIHAGKVGLYTCGPTVYNYAHIGNLRTYIFEDILRRTLEAFDYRVDHVMNITDVGHLTDDADQGEDKMVKGAREQGKTVWEIAEFYAQAFFHDLESLNILAPTQTCRATEHIDDMIRLIQRLGDKGCTYQAGGNLYFDISRFKKYGQMARLKLDDLKAGATIDVDQNKKNPLDFVLWFTRSKFEHQAMLWDSPWGRGYPGWHIECSAMSMKYLSDHFDIHCGGVDHINVHHTNEIAQSEAAVDHIWVNYWMHGEFLILSKDKMAKSSGNFLTINSLVEMGYDPLDYRYFCLGAQYRSQLQFSFKALDAARSGRRNLIDRITRLKLENKGLEPVSAQAVTGQAAENLKGFYENLAQDLNMPKALASMWTLLRAEDILPDQKLGALLRMDQILGLNLSAVEPKEIDGELKSDIEALIEEREQARKQKDYTRADEIRTDLSERGIILEDTPQGVNWYRERD
jgi:cysteinyl-tRNA synthetase